MTGDIPPSLPPSQPNFGQPPIEEELLAKQFYEKTDAVVEKLEQLTRENAQNSRYLSELAEDIQELYAIANEASKLGR